MTTASALATDAFHIGAVALSLLRKSAPTGRGVTDPSVTRDWVSRQLAQREPAISGIELHEKIVSGVPGSSIATLIVLLDMTREDFSDLLGRTRKTVNELVRRDHLSRADSDLLYRIARAVVRAVSAFEDADYAIQWLKEPNEALGGSRPLGLLATVEGDDVVHSELGAVEHGLPV